MYVFVCVFVYVGVLTNIQPNLTLLNVLNNLISTF